MPKVKHICEGCKKEFYAWKCQKRKFCSQVCGLKQVHRISAEKRKTGKELKCQYCQKDFYVSGWKEKASRGKYCSQECYWKDKSKKYSGEKNPQYKDGRVKKNGDFYVQIEWRKMRKWIYERDNYECQICGKHGGELHAHHIIPVGECKNPLRKSNIITLCRKCHQQHHSLE